MTTYMFVEMFGILLIVNTVEYNTTYGAKFRKK